MWGRNILEKGDDHEVGRRADLSELEVDGMIGEGGGNAVRLGRWSAVFGQHGKRQKGNVQQRRGHA